VAALPALAALGHRRASAPPSAVHVVRMVMNGQTPRFDPATVTVRSGDRVRFVVASGAPHNVTFDPAKLPPDVRRALSAGMPDQMQPLAGRLLLDEGESYTLSVNGVRPGRYEFYCLPHVGMEMKGTLVVR
jgi:plastocyanin